MTSTESTPVRNTRQRSQIRQTVEQQAGFATAQEIHEQLRQAGSKVGLATVYRNLQALVAAEELDAIRTPDGQIAYRTCSPGHHHHLICRTCGRTVEVNIPTLEKQIRALATEQGFAQVEHELEFFGTCTSCASSAGAGQPVTAH